ncbi:hypothetical protein [Amycolatopsis palatopharyngis]|uniref:hypothetical protein n=1 Tax=Amycolatopsis palatopharyngis TaxID=187982 RepID=UPI000E2305C7|nr:hypothetical protein [Amycolatopsis palatopharyngis]
MSLDDDAVEELDLVLGQTHHLLGEAGDELAQRLVQGTKLTLRRDGGYFHPTPGDNWRSDTYEAVFEVAPSLVPEFASEIVDRIWSNWSQCCDNTADRMCSESSLNRRYRRCRRWPLIGGHKPSSHRLLCQATRPGGSERMAATRCLTG